MKRVFQTIIKVIEYKFANLKKYRLCVENCFLIHVYSLNRVFCCEL